MTITEPTPDLDVLLRDPDPLVRRTAVAQVAEEGLRGSGDSLAWLLADPDEGVRRAASAALRDLPEIYLGEDGIQALLLAATGGADPQVRTTAAELLDLLRESARELYAQGLHDGEPHLRIQAVFGLVALRAVTDVAEAADDPARDVRVAVAEGLARLATPPRPPAASPGTPATPARTPAVSSGAPAVSSGAPAVSSGTPSVSSGASAELPGVAAGGRGAARGVPGRAEPASSGARRTGASASARGAVAGRVMEALDQLVTDHDPVVRMAALDAAAVLGLPAPLDARAVVATAHSSWQVRKRAVLALGVAEPEVAVAPLVAALRDRIVDVRRAAVQSLEAWAAADPEVVTALTEALNDPDPGVRTQARWALA